MNDLIQRYFIFLLLSLLASTSYSANINDLTIMTEEYPPFNYSNEGKPSGIAVDLLISASTAAGYPIRREQITIASWARAYQTALNQPNTLLFSTTRTDEREKLFKWAGPIAHNRVVIWAKKSSRLNPLLEPHKATEKIGVIRDDVGDQLVVKAGVEEKMIARVSHPWGIARMLASDRIKLWAYSELSSKKLLEAIGENISDYEIVHILDEKGLYFAFSDDVPDDLVDTLQQGIQSVRQHNN